MFTFYCYVKTVNDTSPAVPPKALLIGKKYLKEQLLPRQCGKRAIAKSTGMVQQRIASGFVAERGAHPWQVGLQ